MKTVEEFRKHSVLSAHVGRLMKKKKGFQMYSTFKNLWSLLLKIFKIL